MDEKFAENDRIFVNEVIQEHVDNVIEATTNWVNVTSALRHELNGYSLEFQEVNPSERPIEQTLKDLYAQMSTELQKTVPAISIEEQEHALAEGETVEKTKAAADKFFEEIMEMSTQMQQSTIREVAEIGKIAVDGLKIAVSAKKDGRKAVIEAQTVTKKSFVAFKLAEKTEKIANTNSELILKTQDAIKTQTKTVNERITTLTTANLNEIKKVANSVTEVKTTLGISNEEIVKVIRDLSRINRHSK